MNRLDHDYFNWLTSQIRIPNGKTYHELFGRMHELEFVWTVPNDDNRVQDGLDLRPEFLDGSHGKLNLQLVSILEVLIALSRRLAFLAGGDPRHWAWHLLKNLRLHKMSDPLNKEKRDKVEEILGTLVWRTYRSDGLGGFFPLRNPPEDLTRVELWYQMNMYVNEIKS